jgi:hypothetical protein
MGGFVLDKPDDIRAFHMLAQYHALKAEVERDILVNRQMQRRSLAKFIREQYGVKGRTKRETLDNFEKLLYEQGVLR